LSGAADAAYPDKPITMIVAYSPGGGAGIVIVQRLPAEFEREIKDAEVGFRQLSKELPWGDK
jgi:hypothetical protein